MSLNDCSGEIPVIRGRPEGMHMCNFVFFATFEWKVCSERTKF